MVIIGSRTVMCDCLFCVLSFGIWSELSKSDNFESVFAMKLNV